MIFPSLNFNENRFIFMEMHHIFNIIYKRHEITQKDFILPWIFSHSSCSKFDHNYCHFTKNKYTFYWYISYVHLNVDIRLLTQLTVMCQFLLFSQYLFLPEFIWYSLFEHVLYVYLLLFHAKFYSQYTQNWYAPCDANALRNVFRQRKLLSGCTQNMYSNFGANN